MGNEEHAKAPVKADLDQLPTLKQALEQWLGVQLPGLPSLPNTLKNLDKACAAMLDVPAAHFEAKASSIRGASSRQEEIADTLAENVIEELKLGQSPEAKSAVSGMLREHLQKQYGRKRVLELTASELESGDIDKDATESINDDWMTFFRSRVDELSSEESRLLFAKILAGEVKEPGAFSRSSITILAEMNQRVGHLFDVTCSMATVLGPGPHGYAAVSTLGMAQAGKNSLAPYGLTFSDLNLLNEAGLIIANYHSNIAMYSAAAGHPFMIGASNYDLVPHEGRFKDRSEQAAALSVVSGVALTAAGRELMTIVSKGDNDAYIQALTGNFESAGFILRKLPAD